MTKIHYRAVHKKTLWRKVDNHQSLEAAINGKDGAAALFAGKARIDYQLHGDPLYVVVWEEDSISGVLMKADVHASKGRRQISIAIDEVLRMDTEEGVGLGELERYFSGYVKYTSGLGDNTKIGAINRNNQKCHGTLGEKGTEFNQVVYKLECCDCGFIYGANGSDIADRRCPECQNGVKGIRYWKTIR